MFALVWSISSEAFWLWNVEVSTQLTRNSALQVWCKVHFGLWNNAYKSATHCIRCGSNSGIHVSTVLVLHNVCVIKNGTNRQTHKPLLKQSKLVLFSIAMTIESSSSTYRMVWRITGATWNRGCTNQVMTYFVADWWRQTAILTEACTDW